MRLVLPLLAASLLALPADGSAQTPGPPPPSLRIVRVLVDGTRPAVFARNARLLGGSPDGGAIAFMTSDGLWVTNGTPASNRRLAVDVGDGRGLDVGWSGDRRRLALGTCLDAFSWCKGDVVVVDVRTGRKTVLPFSAESPSLSPDGRRIAVATKAGTSVVATLAGRVLVRLGRVEQVRFAPRGRMLAYVNQAGWVCVMRTDGKARRCLAHGTHPVWSPRATKVAFQASRNFGFTWRFAVAHVTGPPRVRYLSPLVDFPPDAGRTGRNGGLSWSPDGRRVAFGIGDLHIVPGKTLRPLGDSICSALTTAFTRARVLLYTSECL